MTKINYFITALALISFAFGANSQTRYVSTSGTDASNNCDLPGNPCASIAQAVAVASANDSILVEAGSYTFGSTVNISTQGIVLTAMDPADKPVITVSTPDAISVTAPNVGISNFVFRMGLLINGKRGIVATGNFNNITIKNNEFISITPAGIWSPNGVVFGSYAILLNPNVGTPAMATVEDNKIGPLDDEYANFGRGIGLGFNDGTKTTPYGNFTGNEIYAYFPIQAIHITGNLNFENNDFSGLTMFSASLAGANVILDNNTFDAVNDDLASYLYAILDIRAYGNGSITVSNNDFINYSNVALLSMASRNVEVLNNTFTPSSTANDFVSIVANTKLMTAGTQNNTYSDGITIKGNMFNSGSVGEGAAILFGDHYGANTPAFVTTVVGGPTPNERNTFDTNLKSYIVLDSLEGSSENVPLWSTPEATAVTIMKQFTQDVDAWVLHNNYSLYTVAQIEEKNTDSLDLNTLGKVNLGDISSVSIAELSTNDFNIYPNPTSEKLNVSIKDISGNVEISIVDLAGRELMNATINPTGNDFNYVIECSKLTNGNYFVNLKTNSGSSTQKFVKL